MERDAKRIARPIAESIFDAFIQHKMQYFTIACNTASLAIFTDEIHVQVKQLSRVWRRNHLWARDPKTRSLARSIPREGLVNGTHYMLIDTLTSLRSATPQKQFTPRVERKSSEPETKPQNRALMLATEALASEAQDSYQFFTPLDERSGLPEHTQSLIQEIIWRIKLHEKNDVKSAMRTLPNGKIVTDYEHFDPHFPYGEETLVTLLKKIRELLLILHAAGYTKLVLACTELPIAFKLANTYGLVPPGYDPMIVDMARVNAYQLSFALGHPVEDEEKTLEGIPLSKFGARPPLHREYTVEYFRRVLGLENMIPATPSPTPAPAA